jgi:hypothetical protein
VGANYDVCAFFDGEDVEGYHQQFRARGARSRTCGTKIADRRSLRLCLNRVCPYGSVAIFDLLAVVAGVNSLFDGHETHPITAVLGPSTASLTETRKCTWLN